MYTEDAVTLIKELKRYHTGLAPFNQERVRNIIREINKIYQDVQSF